MTRVFTRSMLWAVLCIQLISTAEAQIFTPTFMAPRAASDLGLYLSDGPGDFSVEGIWRQSTGGYDLGLRLGLADTDGVSAMVGAEIRNPLAVGAPLDMAVTAAGQGIFGERSGGGFQLGLALGHTFVAPSISLTPYLHPRVGLVKPLRQDDFGLELLADFGFDVRFDPALELRFGIALHDFGATWGIGFAWR